jgi:aspartate racemase
VARKPLIGLVSGLGPLAGADVLRKLLEHAATAHGARDDVDYPDVLVISHGIPGFDSTGSINPQFENALLSVVDELELHQPSILGMACNTAHLFREAVKAHTGARFVDIIEETARCAGDQPGEYLLISSSTTRSTGLYHEALDRRGVHYREVGGADQLKIDEVVDLVMACRLRRAGAELDAFLHRLDVRRHFSGVIAGCTELPLALDRAPRHAGWTIVESNRALAVGLADAYLGASCGRGLAHRLGVSA